MTTVTYRLIANAPPPALETLTLSADGSLAAWRSNGPAVGRFRGRPEDGARLSTLASAAGAAPAGPGARPTPDGATETLEVGDEARRVPAGSVLPGTWGTLLDACRAAHAASTEPVAAIGVAFAGPDRLRLEHLGDEPLTLGFGRLLAWVRREVDGVGSVVAEARPEDGIQEAGPGWTMEIVLASTGEPDTPGAALVATAAFSVKHEGIWIPVLCETRSGG